MKWGTFDWAVKINVHNFSMSQHKCKWECVCRVFGPASRWLGQKLSQMHSDYTFRCEWRRRAAADEGMNEINREKCELYRSNVYTCCLLLLLHCHSMCLKCKLHARSQYAHKSIAVCWAFFDYVDNKWCVCAVLFASQPNSIPINWWH